MGLCFIKMAPHVALPDAYHHFQDMLIWHAHIPGATSGLGTVEEHSSANNTICTVCGELNYQKQGDKVNDSAMTSKFSPSAL